MTNKLNDAGKSLFPAWVYLMAILLLALFLRLAGIWRSEPIDYHPDEYKISVPVYTIANNAQVGLKRDYNWPVCGIIHPLGYSLYALKGWFGPYSYNSILIIQRVLSAVFGTATVFAVFLLMQKIFSRKTAILAASLVAIAKLPVTVGHEGTLRSIVSLVIVTIMLLSYDLFEVNHEQNGRNLRTGKCCLLGLLCGWGTAVRWTVLLSAIPISGAFLLSVWFNRKTGHWKSFAKINTQRIIIIAAIAVLSFLAANPDFQFAPQKVLSGLMLHKQQGKVGHYGDIDERSNLLVYKLTMVATKMSNCGSIYLFIAGAAAAIFCLVRPTRPRVFLLWTMIVWLIVLHRNVLPLERYHLVPFIVMLLLLSTATTAAVENPKRWLRTTAFAGCALLMIIGCLYTLVCISVYWKTDGRILCSRWIKANVPAGSGITWAPRTHKWMAPGLVVDPSLFKMYPRKAEPGKDQYIIAADSIMETFKKHPPDKLINPSDWFPAEPPSMNELILYAEMNKGSGPNLTLVKRFRVKASFLGLDLSLFGRDANTELAFANRAVTLFRFNKPPQVTTTDEK